MAHLNYYPVEPYFRLRDGKVQFVKEHKRRSREDEAISPPRKKPKRHDLD